MNYLEVYHLISKNVGAVSPCFIIDFYLNFITVVREHTLRGFDLRSCRRLLHDQHRDNFSKEVIDIYNKCVCCRHWGQFCQVIYVNCVI